MVIISTFAIFLFLKLLLRKNLFHQSVETEICDGVKENCGDRNSRKNIFLDVFGNLVSQGRLPVLFSTITMM